MKSFQDQLQQSPYRNTTLADRLVAYFQVLRTHWSLVVSVDHQVAPSLPKGSL